MMDFFRRFRHAVSMPDQSPGSPLRLALLISLLTSACVAYSAEADATPSATTDKAPLTKQVPRTVIRDQKKLAELTVTELSANLVDRVIHDLPVERHIQLISQLDADELDEALDTQQKQLTFWINIYNGFTQYFLKKDPSLYQQDRGKFFGKKQIEVAGYTVSMEDIEHGVLRRGATVLSAGYIRALWLRSRFIKQFAVDEVDYRIHFALNCGALSCPPVVAYQEDLIDRQLDDNSRYYLQREVVVEDEGKLARIPALMLWFSADFGSSDDKVQLLIRHGALAPGLNPQLDYLPYDWTIAIENYRSYQY